MNILTLIFPIFFCVSCSPTVKVEAPDKPIDVNMNVNIKHTIKVTKKYEKEPKVDELTKTSDSVSPE